MNFVTEHILIPIYWIYWGWWSQFQNFNEFVTTAYGQILLTVQLRYFNFCN